MVPALGRPTDERAGLDGLVAIGGDGTLAIGYEFSKLGLPIVGVPKTIDNDIAGTLNCFGFDTAVQFATDAIDRLHTTAESHHRVMVVEVMGRDAGWIALEAGIAGGAHIILIPEIPFTIEKICRHLTEREQYGKRFTIMVVAEGVKLPPEMKQMSRTFAVGNMIGDAIAIVAHKEVRVSVLGHIQRGGTPTAFDRILATRFGVKVMGFTNLPARLPADASSLYARNLLALLPLLTDKDSKAFAPAWDDEIIKGCLVTHGDGPDEGASRICLCTIFCSAREAFTARASAGWSRGGVFRSRFSSTSVYCVIAAST